MIPGWNSSYSEATRHHVIKRWLLALKGPVKPSIIPGPLQYVPDVAAMTATLRAMQNAQPHPHNDIRNVYQHYKAMRPRDLGMMDALGFGSIWPK